MKKYLLICLIFIFILYYLFTFIFSFASLANSVVNNDFITIKRYLNEKTIKKNFYNDIYKFSSNFSKLVNKDILIKNKSIEFTGELTPAFFDKFFSKIASNISTDFAEPEIMLYFYFNSNELSMYLDQSFSNFGDYNFQKYVLEKKIKDTENTLNNLDIKKDIKKIEEKNINQEEDKKVNIILNLIKKIRSTDHFFFTSPMYFKIDVKHQNISFIIILKFNGYKWIIQKIKIPYIELIEKKNIMLIK